MASEGTELDVYRPGVTEAGSGDQTSVSSGLGAGAGIDAGCELVTAIKSPILADPIIRDTYLPLLAASSETRALARSNVSNASPTDWPLLSLGMALPEVVLSMGTTGLRVQALPLSGSRSGHFSIHDWAKALWLGDARSRPICAFGSSLGRCKSVSFAGT